MLEAVAPATRRNATSATAVGAAQLEIKAERGGDGLVQLQEDEAPSGEGRAVVR